MLWPRAEGAGGFTARPSAFIESYIEPDEGEPLSLAQLYRESALHAENALDQNEQAHFKELTRYFRAAVLLLMFESAAWVVALAAS